MHNNLGIVLQELGKLEDAVASYQKALTIKPNIAEAHNNLGLVLFELGRPEEAIANYRKALTIMPDLVESHYNLGNVLWKLGRLDKAQASYHEALRLKPDYAEAHHNLGNVFWVLGKEEKAEANFRQALRLKPDYADAHNNLGNVLWVLGKEEEAEANFQKAITINPNFTEAYSNLGALYHAHHRFEEAVASLHKALDLNPDYAEAYANLGLALQDQGKTDEAAKQIDLALSHKPEQDGWRIRKALLLPVIPYSKQDTQVRRDTLAKAVKNLMKQNLTVPNPLLDVGTTHFYLAYHDQNDRTLMEDIAKLYIAACPKLTYEAKHCESKQRSGKGVLRIGFLSAYFQNHPVGKFTRGIIQYLSRDHFEVIVFRPPGRQDHISEIIDQTADKTVPLCGRLEKDRERIEDEKLDILFYPDIGMSPLTYFLAFARLAPVQVTTWLHPDTNGIPNMDYFLSSELSEIAGATEHYSEQLITLKYWAPYYFRPDPPKNKYTPSDYGLPHGARFYVCPQTLFKFHPAFDDILGELLRRDPKGRLILIACDHGDRPGDLNNKAGNWRKLLLERFFRSFPEVAENVIFVPRMPPEKYLGLLILADALLDIPTFSGGNTSLEAFAMGAPIVTWPQDFVRGRSTTGLYKQMGLSDLIATDANSYLRLALQLAQDADFKRRMQEDIKANAHKLYERFEEVEEMETFFISAYKAWQAGTALTNPTI